MHNLIPSSQSSQNQSPLKRARPPLGNIKPTQSQKNVIRGTQDSGYFDESIANYSIFSTPENSQKYLSPSKVNVIKRNRKETPSPQKQLRLPHILIGMREFGSPTKLWDGLCQSADEKINKNYARFSRVVLHSETHSFVRIIMYENLLQICASLNLHRETFHLAMDLCDRYLTRTEDDEGLQDQCVSIGMAAIFVAGKMEEHRTPSTMQLIDAAYQCGSDWAECKKDHIILGEEELLEKTGYYCTQMTGVQWLVFFLQLIAAQDEFHAPRPKKARISEPSTSDLHDSDCVDWMSDTSQNSLASASTDQHFSMAEGKLREFACPKYFREEFIHLASVLDIAMVDKEYLTHSYRHLAAAVIYLAIEEDIAEQVTGITKKEIHSTLYFMEPYYRAMIPEFSNSSILAQCNQTRCPMRKVLEYDGASPSSRINFDQHNIQPMYENAADLIVKAMQYRKEMDKLEEAKENKKKSIKRNLFGTSSSPRKILSPKKHH
ncbi:unnamed protein product [Bursaphelenchus okinawaensis]|uniref:Cyclin-like domain-containing protein n=1 Tax=Bursaphelenchus okinawaensis TaxID=465554 RepID=A0A811KGJ5_9BILA|nr:unnamed protein product [Bursaphelenchus okinawaensis]CAG9102515.1 unnamed protein product [Bursaphelenchus okinawaensis]